MLPTVIALKKHGGELVCGSYILRFHGSIMTAMKGVTEGGAQTAARRYRSSARPFRVAASTSDWLIKEQNIRDWPDVNVESYPRFRTSMLPAAVTARGFTHRFSALMLRNISWEGRGERQVLKSETKYNFWKRKSLTFFVFLKVLQRLFLKRYWS